jgi:DNA-binding beta-propeller fold protein YncE
MMDSGWEGVEMTKSELRIQRWFGKSVWLSLALALALVLNLALMIAVSAQYGEEDATADWEVWALDQGTDLNRIHIYQLQDDEFVEVETIVFGDLDEPHNAVRTPHMISFDQSNRYAAVASTASGTVSIIRTSDYEVIETIETGATAHMAHWAPAPDNSIWVANIGAKSFTQISADLENEVFEIVRDISLSEDVLAAEWPGWIEKFGEDIEGWPGPVCHEFTPDGAYAYVTLGPMAGGIVVVDLDSGEVAQAFDPNEVQANCGVAYSPNHNQMFANWSGDFAGVEDHHAADPGEWYVFDTTTHELVATFSADGEETLGLDPHGARVSPDGTEMWQVNRVSNDGIVVDTASLEIIAEFQIVDTPDIVAFSPDGDYFFITLRGPNPASMPHVAEGQTPGVEVFDVASRESIAVLQPASEDELESSDFHGIGVRGPISAPEADDDEATDDAAVDDATEESDDAVEADDEAADDVAETADDATDDYEDMVPATGSSGTSSYMMTGLLAAFAAAALGLGAILRSRSHATSAGSLRRH